MGKLIGSILELFDVDSEVVSRMALIFDVQPRILNLADGGLELCIVFAEKDCIVNVDHENDVAAKEDAIVNHRSLVPKIGQLVHEKLVPNSTSLLLAIDVFEKFQDVIR